MCELHVPDAQQSPERLTVEIIYTQSCDPVWVCKPRVRVKQALLHCQMKTIEATLICKNIQSGLCISALSSLLKPRE